MSQVLVPPLATEYNTVRDAWMDQKLWSNDNFIEVLSEDCPAKVKAKVVEAIYQYLELCVTFPLTFPCYCHVTHRSVPGGVALHVFGWLAHRSIELDTGGNACHCYPYISSIDSFFAVHGCIDDAVWSVLSCGADRMHICVWMCMCVGAHVCERANAAVYAAVYAAVEN